MGGAGGTRFRVDLHLFRPIAGRLFSFKPISFDSCTYQHESLTLIPQPCTHPCRSSRIVRAQNDREPRMPTSQPSLPESVQALVIGAGPSGLVSLKYLIEYGPSLGLVSAERIRNGTGVLGVEMEADIGGTFRYRGYENAELVSSKQLTCFSDFRYVFCRSSLALCCAK